MRLELPLLVKALGNRFENGFARAKRRKMQRHAVGLMWGTKKAPPFPLVVTMTRIGPRVLDNDNLGTSLKSVRDEIAARLGVDDGGPEVRWVPAQKLGKQGLIIEVRHDMERCDERLSGCRSCWREGK